jgi:hypothetical protein
MPRIKYLPPPPDIYSSDNLKDYSSIINEELANKIITYFPEDK